jgi:hypothetical protein
MMVTMLCFSLMVHIQYNMRVVDTASILGTNVMELGTALNVCLQAQEDVKDPH